MASFNLFIPILQKIEGGYQNLAGDDGNYNSLGIRVGTNFGISARFYEDIIGRPPTVADMKAITKDKAKVLYKKYGVTLYGTHYSNQPPEKELKVINTYLTLLNLKLQ